MILEKTTKSKPTVYDTDNTELSVILNYAAGIQGGMLPKDRHLKKISDDYGIIWYPHSILSGDFFWTTQKEEDFYIAVGDCTGHGIPASLLSVMGINLLNYIVLGKDFEFLGSYLEEMDKKWIETFHSDNENNPFNNDWLEISLIKFNKKNINSHFPQPDKKYL